jgi:hypothetical protein
MHKNVLIASSLMIGALVIAMINQSLIGPAVASDASACATKQDRSPSAQPTITEMDGIRFQTFVTQDEIGEQSTSVPSEREIQIPPNLGKALNRNAPDPGDYRIMNIYVRASNCTNRAIRFGRFSALVPDRLSYPNGQEVKSVSSSASTVDLKAIGSVLVQPGASLNFKMDGFLAWDKNILTLIFGRSEQRTIDTYVGLSPGQVYQLQLTFQNRENQKSGLSGQAFSIVGGKPPSTKVPLKEVEVWKGKVVLSPILFRLAKPKN